MIHFEKVRWKNFLSTGNQFTEIELDRNETTLIIGENGAGKSTVLDALCFALFGKPFRTISKSQLVNTVNAMETVVEIEFSIASRKYKIVRGIKPNVFEIWQNNKMLNQEANSRDYQKILEQQILKLNYRSFTQVVILGSSTFVPFMQLKARFRREVVEDLLDIKIFSMMNMLLKQRLKDLVGELQEIEYEYKLSGEKIIMQEAYIEDIKKNKDVIVKEKENDYEHNAKELMTILPKCIEEGAESIELHSGVPDDISTMKEWAVVSDSVPNGLISMCLDRNHLCNDDLIERIEAAKEIAGDRLIIQADGIPMSGGKDDFNTTLQAVSIAEVINKRLKNRYESFKNLPILISGGTNSYTGNLARQLKVEFNGITIGTHARKVISNFKEFPKEISNDNLLKAFLISS